MKANIPLADLVEGGKLNFIDTDKIDELMALFRSLVEIITFTLYLSYSEIQRCCYDFPCRTVLAIFPHTALQ